MMAALRKVQVARAQGIAYSQGEGDLPKALIQGPILLFQRGAPAGGHELQRRLTRQCRSRAGAQLASQPDARQQPFRSRGALERQGEEGREVTAQMGVTGPQLILVAILLQALELATVFQSFSQPVWLHAPIEAG